MKNLLLLHGALGTAAQFDDLIPYLDTDFSIHRLTFAGHGDQRLAEGKLRIEALAADTLAALDSHNLQQTDIFGYSMGGYVALHLAHIAPGRVGRVFTLGTELLWSPERAARDVKMLDADAIEAKVPHFARALETRHTALGWRGLLEVTAEMLVDLGEHPRLAEETLRSLPQRIRLGVGDRDTTAGVADTYEAYRMLKQGEFQVFPATPHPFERIDLGVLAHAIRAFFLS